MFHKVLVPTDFSAPADRLLDCLDELGALGLKEVLLLHVTDVRQSHSLLGFDLTYLERHNELARAELARRCRQVEALGLACRPLQTEDVPDHGIVAAAAQENCDLILIGSQGRTSLRDVLLGSTAENVIRQATVPVLLVKLRAIENMGRQVCDYAFERMFRKVLVPTDFSPAAERTMEFVRGLRGSGTEEVVLVHVQDVRKLRPHLDARMSEFNQIDAGRLDVLRAALESEGFRASTRLEEGIPVQEILSAADQEDVGLIVIGLQGRTALAEALMGSVSAEVIRQARQAVLVVR